MHLGPNYFHTAGEGFQVDYIYKYGANYSTYLNNPSLLDPADDIKPDYVIVILAGNGITNDVSSSELYQQASQW